MGSPETQIVPAIGLLTGRLSPAFSATTGTAVNLTHHMHQRSDTKLLMK
jgi:hypothetical protein